MSLASPVASRRWGKGLTFRLPIRGARQCRLPTAEEKIRIVFDAPPLDGATEALAQVKISDLASPTAATAPALIKASPGTDAASPDTVVFGFGNDDEDF